MPKINPAVYIARHFVERADALNLKPKQRDEDALTFFLGAADAALMLGDVDTYSHLGNVAGMLISVRGYVEVKMLAAKPLEMEPRATDPRPMTAADLAPEDWPLNLITDVRSYFVDGRWTVTFNIDGARP